MRGVLAILAGLLLCQPVLAQTVSIQQSLALPAVLSTPGDVVLGTNGASGVSLTVAGTFTGLTAQVQGSTDNSTFTGPLTLVLPNGAGIATTISGTGTWNVPTGKYSAVRLHVTAVGSGSLSVAWGGMTGTPLTIMCPDGTTTCFGGGGSPTVTASQGTPNTAANAWPVTLAIGGAVASATNPSPVIPGTSANFAKETGGNLASILTALGSPFQAAGALGAGSAIVGKVGIDQTTPGTTNGVQVNAGQAGIGNVGGKTVQVCNALTVTATNSYGTNYVVGGLQTFANAFTSTGSGILQAVTVTMKDQEVSGFTFVPFNANPTNTTWTDAAISAINAADVAKVRGPVPLASNTQLASTLYSAQYAYGIGLAMAPGTTSLYGVLLTNAALTNQFAGTGDVQVCVVVLDDE